MFWSECCVHHLGQCPHPVVRHHPTSKKKMYRPCGYKGLVLRKSFHAYYWQACLSFLVRNCWRKSCAPAVICSSFEKIEPKDALFSASREAISSDTRRHIQLHNDFHLYLYRLISKKTPKKTKERWARAKALVLALCSHLHTTDTLLYRLAQPDRCSSTNWNKIQMFLYDY